MMIAPFFYLFSYILLPHNTNDANVPKSIKPAQGKEVKYIYLTFDDGPLVGTSSCIDICLNQKVQATFFEVGRHQAANSSGKALYYRIAQYPQFFDIANHSYTHANGKYKYFYHHPNMAFDDFVQAKKSLQVKNNIIRLPGNSAWNTMVLKKSSQLVKPVVLKLDSAGYNVIGWDLEWGFTKQGTPKESPQAMAKYVDTLFARNRTETKNHLVILMHDHMYRNSVDSAKLATMIAILKANPRYQFRKLSLYPGLKNGGRP